MCYIIMYFIAWNIVQFINGEFDHLLLSTDSYIYRIPPQRCDRFMTCGWVEYKYCSNLLRVM